MKRLKQSIGKFKQLVRPVSLRKIIDKRGLVKNAHMALIHVKRGKQSLRVIYTGDALPKGIQSIVEDRYRKSKKRRELVVYSTA